MLKLQTLRLIRRFGYDLRRRYTGLTPGEVSVVERVKAYTATGPGRIVGLVDAIKYIVKNRIPGPIVECGVWRGGSIMAAACTLLELGDTSRDLYLFDTFEGMSTPTARDRGQDGTPAEFILSRLERSEEAPNAWCVAGVDAVRKNVLSTGYPAERLHLIQGKVEDTLPHRAPPSIALLRLDTDWYESTRHELVHLYPRLVQNGVLIIDDYGDWVGAKEAVDEFFAAQPFQPLLSRMDDTGRLVIKSAPA